VHFIEDYFFPFGRFSSFLAHHLLRKRQVFGSKGKASNASYPLVLSANFAIQCVIHNNFPVFLNQQNNAFATYKTYINAN
jgi:hypothetical protein